MKRSKTLRPRRRTHVSMMHVYLSVISLFLMAISVFALVLLLQNRQSHRTQAAPSPDLQTDRLNQSFTGAGYTSEYHIFASGLDWTKPVGLLMFTDGSGESGLKGSMTSNYMFGGPTGLIAVAKKHNMVLLTPFSPNKACSDDGESCWYDGDSPGYAKWAEALVTSVESQYGIDKRRVAVGGYSSGATFTTGWWVPSGAAMRTMDAGVVIPISYGGAPQMDEVVYTPAFKSGIHMHWNVGDADEALSTVKRGYDYFTKAGFQTSIEILPGVGHSRSGQFGPIFDAQITKYIPAVPNGPVITTAPNVPSPAYCGGSTNCVPSGAPTSMPTGTNPNLLPSVYPSSMVTPAPIDDTNPDQDNGNNNDDKGNNNGNDKGFLGFILELIKMILEFFASLFK